MHCVIVLIMRGLFTHAGGEMSCVHLKMDDLTALDWIHLISNTLSIAIKLPGVMEIALL